MDFANYGQEKNSTKLVIICAIYCTEKKSLSAEHDASFMSVVTKMLMSLISKLQTIQQSPNSIMPQVKLRLTIKRHTNKTGG